MNRHNTLSSENMKAFFKSRNLPHIFAANKPIFLSYRLKFTLPQKVMDQYQQRIEAWREELESLSQDEKDIKVKEKDRRFFIWFDQILGLSPDVPRLLHQECIREIIEASFKHFDGLRYILLGYCIMPNHVHVLILPLAKEDGSIFPIPHIVYTWKKYTATAINQVLGRKGSLWQKEGYDSLVRDEKGLGQVLEYIINNPVKAKLVEDWRDWRGTYVRSGLF